MNPQSPVPDLCNPPVKAVHADILPDFPQTVCCHASFLPYFRQTAPADNTRGSANRWIPTSPAYAANLPDEYGNRRDRIWFRHKRIRTVKLCKSFSWLSKIEMEDIHVDDGDI